MTNIEKISIFIPVYRESEILRQTLTFLLEDPYERKEIFVVIDEPTEKSINIVKEFFPRGIHFKLNGVRKGKVNALNEVVKEASGDIFLFLDADVLLNDSVGQNFLETIAKAMKDAEIIEIKKQVIRDSFVARIANYDYIGFALASLYFSRKVGRCLAINGAAFAIKRETFEALGGFRRTICEDLDIATRSFANGARFKFIDGLAVLTKAPSSLRGWFNQRKRWAIGAAFWIKDNFRILRRALRKHPRAIALSLLSAFPSIPLLLASLLIPDKVFAKVAYMLLLLLSTTTSLLVFPVALTSIVIPAVKCLTMLLISFLGYSLTFFIFAKKLGFPFNLLEFAAYYFVMAPLWLMLIVSALIRLCIKRDKVNIDWKV